MVPLSCEYPRLLSFRGSGVPKVSPPKSSCPPQQRPQPSPRAKGLGPTEPPPPPAPRAASRSVRVHLGLHGPARVRVPSGKRDGGRCSSLFPMTTLTRIVRRQFTRQTWVQSRFKQHRGKCQQSSDLARPRAPRSPQSGSSVRPTDGTAVCPSSPAAHPILIRGGGARLRSDLRLHHSTRSASCRCVTHRRRVRHVPVPSGLPCDHALGKNPCCHFESCSGSCPWFKCHLLMINKHQEVDLPPSSFSKSELDGF